MSEEIKRIDINRAIKLFTEPGERPRLYPICDSYGYGSGCDGGAACLTSALVAQVSPETEFHQLSHFRAADILRLDRNYVLGLVHGWDGRGGMDFDSCDQDYEMIALGMKDGGDARIKLMEQGVEVVPEDDDDDDDDWLDDDYEEDDDEW